MPKYRVYNVGFATYLVGEYEAENKDAAEDMADASPQNDEPSLCHHCEDEFELGVFFEYQTDEA